MKQWYTCYFKTITSRHNWLVVINSESALLVSGRVPFHATAGSGPHAASVSKSPSKMLIISIQINIIF